MHVCNAKIAARIRNGSRKTISFPVLSMLCRIFFQVLKPIRAHGNGQVQPFYKCFCEMYTGIVSSGIDVTRIDREPIWQTAHFQGLNLIRNTCSAMSVAG